MKRIDKMDFEKLFPGHVKTCRKVYREYVDQFFFKQKEQQQQGGGGQTGAQQVAAAPVPGVTPPVTSTNAEVVQVQNDLRRQSLRKRGFAKTILAGETGGWAPSATPNPSTPKPTANPPSFGKLG